MLGFSWRLLFLTDVTSFTLNHALSLLRAFLPSGRLTREVNTEYSHRNFYLIWTDSRAFFTAVLDALQQNVLYNPVKQMNPRLAMSSHCNTGLLSHGPYHELIFQFSLFSLIVLLGSDYKWVHCCVTLLYVIISFKLVDNNSQPKLNAPLARCYWFPVRFRGAAQRLMSTASACALGLGEHCGKTQ